MAKVSPRKHSAKQQAPRRATPDFFGNIGLQTKLIFALACLLYANTLGHGFVLDDGIVITENTFVKDGLKGIGNLLSHDSFYGFFQQGGMDNLVAGGRYRPASMVLFALIYQIFGANPMPFHLITVLLFALTCTVVYRTLLRLLNGAHPLADKIAWLAAVLFAVHPIHTEVVANIKSCDEILAMLGSISALYYALKARDTGRMKWAYISGGIFLLACLSKENAAAYALLIPLALWFFKGSAAPENTQPSVLSYSWPVFASLVLFLIVRGAILPWNTLSGGNAPAELLNNPFLKLEGSQWVPFSFSEKIATILYTLWKYVQLLFVPHPLTHDYYPRQIDIMSFSNPFVLLAIALYGWMVYRIIQGWKKHDAIAYALLLYLLPLGIVSNLLFPIGTNMSERFVFMPSLGFCLLVALWLGHYMEKNSRIVWQLFAITALLFSIKTVLRNSAWQSNEKLYATDANVSDNSIKLQCAYAQSLLERARTVNNTTQKQSLCREGLTRVAKALKFYPDFQTAISIRAGLYLELGQYPEAIADYRHTLAMSPNSERRKILLAFGLREAGRDAGEVKHDLPVAFKYLNESWQLNPKDPETARLTGVAYMVLGDKNQALSWYEQSEKLAANDAAALWELGMAYTHFGMPDKAQELQQKARALDPKIMEKVQQQ